MILRVESLSPRVRTLRLQNMRVQIKVQKAHLELFLDTNEMF